MNRILVILFLISNVNFLHAQGKWEAGIEGGGGIIGEAEGGFSILSGGITGQYNFTKMFSLKSSFLYAHTEQGGSEPTGDGGIFGWDNQTNYFVLPICAKLSFGNKVKFFVTGGPSFSYLIDQLGINDRINSKTGINSVWVLHSTSNYSSLYVGFILD